MPDESELPARFDANALRDFAGAMLRRAGMPSEKASDVAEILVEGDLLGHETHGLHLLPGYLGEIDSGSMLLDGEPELISDHGAVVTWDGKRLPGPWLMLQAIALASERARRFGIGAVSIRRSHHIAALATYAKRVADEGLVLLLMSSAPASASVAPFGGTRALFSPSPIGVGFPTSGEPVMIDVSTSTTTNTMTALLARSGSKLPGAWLMDEAGALTDDPTVLTPPRKGSILPLGGADLGHKGYGLALMVEALTAGLAGHGRADPVAPLGASVFVLVLDPEAFSGGPAFTRQMDGIVERCRATPPVRPDSPVRLPGERGLRMRHEQLRRGVSLKPGILEALAPWAIKLSVNLPSVVS